jgi:hypothetical protein
LKLTPRFHPLSHLLDPVPGDPFHPLFALRHKRESPSFVAFSLGTMASGLATPGPTHDERARQQIGRDGKAFQRTELTLSPTRGLRALGVVLHLVYI